MLKQPFFIVIIYPLNFYRFAHIKHGNSAYYHAKPIQTRKLHAVSVFVSNSPFFDNIFRQANTPFTQNQQYPTPFYLSVLYYHGNPRLLRESILLPVNTQNPMASFGNSRLCRCYTLMTFTPLYPTQFDIRQTGFDKLRSYRQNPYFSVRRNHIRAALKAVPTHATPPHLMQSALYQTAKNGCSDKMITAFPHFLPLRRSLRLRPSTVSL